jgi:hypothetical protein
VPVRCTTPALMPHSGGDGTSRRGWYRARTWSSGEDGAVLNSPVRRGDDDGGDGGASYVRKTTKRLTGGAGLPARGSAREGVAGRWGRLVSEREGGEHGAATRVRERAGNGSKGGEARARGGGEAAAAWVGFIPVGGRAFSFSFYFLIPISIFVSFLFEQFI